MTDLNTIRRALKRKKENLKKYGVIEIGVFGSYLRGEELPDSDVDILIDISRPAKLDLLDLLTIEHELSEDLDTSVDLVLKSDLKPVIGKKILSEVEYL